MQDSKDLDSTSGQRVLEPVTSYGHQKKTVVITSPPGNICR